MGTKRIRNPRKSWCNREKCFLEKAGVIMRSVSPWASPIVVVPKKDQLWENLLSEDYVLTIEPSIAYYPL